jgi:hypothetical protein
VNRQTIFDLAQQAGAKFPQLVVAQYILESGDGQHLSGKFNYFGLKGPGTLKTTDEYYNGVRTTIKDRFKDFSSPQEAVNYLVERWYKNWKGYSGVNRAKAPEEAANLLYSEGYATDPNYAAKLIRIMSQLPAQQPEYANILDAAKNYEGKPWQDKAFSDLDASLTTEQRKLFTTLWRQGPPATASKPAASKPSTGKPSFPLKVPYFYQRDSKTGHGERMCFSSSMAMAMDYLDPSAIEGDDDSYLRVVFRYGDTVSSDAQIKAARSLGFDAQFRNNLTQADLLSQLDKGIPVPIGVLHKGSVSNPTGGGHWICLTGYNTTHFWVCDPFGEMDVVNGGYVRTGKNDGNQVRYTRKNLMRRWLIQSNNDGWGVIFKK